MSSTYLCLALFLFSTICIQIQVNAKGMSPLREKLGPASVVWSGMRKNRDLSEFLPPNYKVVPGRLGSVGKRPFGRLFGESTLGKRDPAEDVPDSWQPLYPDNTPEKQQRYRGLLVPTAQFIQPVHVHEDEQEADMKHGYGYVHGRGFKRGW